MPAEYVSELADRAFRQAQESTPRGQEIGRVIADMPPDVPGLIGKLISLPSLQAQLASLTGYTPSQWVLERELVHIDARRKNLGIHRVEKAGSSYESASNSKLTGLCFSGGGIRSATFNLGILQALAELDLLPCFDYLSTVSGGGYIHQWFAAWITRKGFKAVREELVPLPSTGSPAAHPEPIRWLRRYSNYLTPEKGILTSDTWVAIAIWLRNALLNQTTLFTTLFVFALILHAASFSSIIPRTDTSATAIGGIVLILFLAAIYFIARELCFETGDAKKVGAFGQGSVQGWLVFPLMASAFLITLLLPVMYEEVGYFGLCFREVLLLLFTLALTITLFGGAPLAYLKSHDRTSRYSSVREFWTQPKCLPHVKFVVVMAGLIVVCLMAAIGGALWILGSFVLVIKLWHFTGVGLFWQAILVVEPPLIVAGPLITMLLMMGLLGRMFQDARREWLARLSAQIGLAILLWVITFSFLLFGHWVVLKLWGKFRTVGLPALLSWIMTSLAGLLAGKSSKVSGVQSVKGSKFSTLEVFALVGPYVFISGLLILISALAEVVVLKGIFVWAVTLFVMSILGALFAWRVDINEFSLHAFYRNRLSRCYMGASNIPRNPNPFTGFDEADTNIAVSDLLPSKNYDGPFPMFCTALNLTFGQDLAWQERKAASFVFTPLYSGYDVPWTAAREGTKLRFNGYVDTATYAYPKPGIHINTAAAISGAALSPNMGYHTNPATSFLMTVFSVRLGWWLRNPRVLNEDGTKLGVQDGLREDSAMHLLRNPYPSPSPLFSLIALAKELLGRTNDTSNYVYLSDGGHFENMGLYELVRRRCRFIVICDSEDDGDLAFGGIGMAIRRCRVDFGAEIDLDLRPLRHVADSQCSSAHCVVGTVKYPGEENTGVVVYIKSSLTGDEPGDIANYKKEHATFPHDSTLNQWFSESQFESYRRLGHHIGFSVFKPALGNDSVYSSAAAREKFFSRLGNIWWAATPEMDRFTATHTERYEALLEKARTDDKLPGFFTAMFSNGSNWKEGHSKEQVEYAVQFSSELIEFIWRVFNQLNLVLVEKRNHPYAVGWSRIFTQWAQIDVVQEGWKRYRDSYSASFQSFAESNCVGLAKK